MRHALKQGESVTDAIYAAGFSSSSRGYEGAQLRMTPAPLPQAGAASRLAGLLAFLLLAG